ncbi:MAG: hypothetical protein MI784_14195 [Cytophagales bacterium]|nr:hypothetical protein [Cytophagales bacterium]
MAAGILLAQWLIPHLVYERVWELLLTIGVAFFSCDRLSESLKKFGEEAIIRLGALVFRLFLGIITAVLFVFFFKADSFAFAINFIVIYLSFLVFEIYSLLAKFRTISN